MRVTGGDLRGRTLPSPRGAVRPTSDMSREALFSILADVSGARVLDLYAGSASLAAEALSRGASEAVLVDTDPRPARRTVEALALGERARVVRSDALAWLRRADPGGFDLVLCDPPYTIARRVAPDLEAALPRHLVPGARVVLESSSRHPAELSWPLVRARDHGETAIRVYRKP